MDNEKDVRKEWDDAAEAWADFVRTGKDHTREGLNNPATFNLIGDVTDHVVLDLACGEGYNTRILARMGAKVTGIDFSEKLIEFARQEEAEEKLGIHYEVMDAADLQKIPDSYLDLVTCFMALQDIGNYRKAASEVARVLKDQARFVFSIPHPCFETLVIKGKRVQAVRTYFETTKYPINWDMKRLEKPFKTTTYHRALTDYFDALSSCGMLVSRLVEPKPTKQACQKYPSLKEGLHRPQSVIIESMKPVRKQ